MSQSISNEELKDIIEDWYHLKKKVSDMEKKIDLCREKIIDYMNDKDIDTLLSGDLYVKKSILDRETISRKDLPNDLWIKYCKKNKTFMYKVGKRR